MPRNPDNPCPLFVEKKDANFGLYSPKQVFDICTCTSCRCTYDTGDGDVRLSYDSNNPGHGWIRESLGSADPPITPKDGEIICGRCVDLPTCKSYKCHCKEE